MTLYIWWEQQCLANYSAHVSWERDLNAHLRKFILKAKASEDTSPTAAAAAKSLQSRPTLCNPIDGSPPGCPLPWDSPGKNTGVGCHFLLQCMNVRSESEVAQSCPTPSDPMDRSLPGTSVHGIFQARVLEWGAVAFSVVPPRLIFIAWFLSEKSEKWPMDKRAWWHSAGEVIGWHCSGYLWCCMSLWVGGRREDRVWNLNSHC